MSDIEAYTVRSFLDAVGRKELTDELEYSPQSVQRAVNNNVFPAHWFFDIRDWCAENGHVVPEYLFRRDHKRSNTQNVNFVSPDQEDQQKSAKAGA